MIDITRDPIPHEPRPLKRTLQAINCTQWFYFCPVCRSLEVFTNIYRWWCVNSDCSEYPGKFFAAAEKDSDVKATVANSEPG